MDVFHLGSRRCCGREICLAYNAGAPPKVGVGSCREEVYAWGAELDEDD